MPKGFEPLYSGTLTISTSTKLKDMTNTVLSLRSTIYKQNNQYITFKMPSSNNKPLTRGGDYLEWKFQMNHQLRTISAWTICTGEEEEPIRPSATADRYTKKDWKDYIARNDIAIATINLGLSTELSRKYDDAGKADDPQTLWDAIEADQNRHIKLNVNHLREEIFAVKLEDCGSVDAYVTKIDNIIMQIRSTGTKFSDDDKHFHLMHGIPKNNDWRAFKVAINASDILTKPRIGIS
jgi:hypothetical protein